MINVKNILNILLIRHTAIVEYILDIHSSVKVQVLLQFYRIAFSLRLGRNTVASLVRGADKAVAATREQR